MLTALQLAKLVRDVPDFPIPGVVFKDITTLLTHPGALADVTSHLEALTAGVEYDAVAAIESRGFVFGAALASRRRLPMVLLRKPGKLPADTISQAYSLEYGTAEIEMHRGSVEEGARVLLVDDLVATGGSAAAAAGLISRDGGEVVGAAFVIELSFLDGASRLREEGVPVHSLIRVGSE